MKLEHVLAFLDDEGLRPVKVKKRDGDLWACSINEPFQPDRDFRCGIAQIRSHKTGLLTPVFNSFKAVANMGDEYKGSFWRFIKLVKGMSSDADAKSWFNLRYALRSMDDARSALAVSTAAGPAAISYERVHFPETFERLKIDDPEHAEYVEYLRARAVSEHRLVNDPIFVDASGRRLVFPVYEGGDMVAWAARAIDKDSKLPWKNNKKYEGMPRPVWNLDRVNGETVAIFEAVFDAIVVHNGVAVLGAGNAGSDEVVSKILAKGYARIFVVMDNDEAGRNMKLKMAQALAETHNDVRVYDFNGIQHKDFNGMAQAGAELNVLGRSRRWDLKAEAMAGMGRLV